MNDTVLNNCMLLIKNRDKVKTVFRWDYPIIHLACAGIYTSKGMEVDISVLQSCKQLVKNKVGLFSNFRGIAHAPIIAMLATSENPEQTLDNALTVYGMLKKEFWKSIYLPLTAMTIAQSAEPYHYEEITAGTRRIYSRIKSEHPFLISSEDSINCALLAMSGKSDDELIHDIEACYNLLRPNFFSLNSVQSLSHILALGQGSPEEKCRKALDIFYNLKSAGYKYGTTYELPTLGVLTFAKVPTRQITSEMIEINNWLAHQKGFGFFSGTSSKQRLMYAGIVAMREYINAELMQSTAVNSVISIIQAAEVAMCAAVSASAAAGASSSSD